MISANPDDDFMSEADDLRGRIRALVAENERLTTGWKRAIELRDGYAAQLRDETVRADALVVVLKASEALVADMRRLGRQLANALHNLDQRFAFSSRDKSTVDSIIKEWDALSRLDTSKTEERS